jgi:hypothetical protein
MSAEHCESIRCSVVAMSEEEANHRGKHRLEFALTLGIGAAARRTLEISNDWPDCAGGTANHSSPTRDD